MLYVVLIYAGNPMTQAIIQQIQEEVRSSSKQAVKSHKIKVTVYLPEEVEQALAELYIERYRNDRKTDRSTIVAEAIVAFAQQHAAKKV
jgi:hypothetical protein